MSLLKKVVGNYHVKQELWAGMWLLSEPAAVLVISVINRIGDSVRQLPIQWKGKAFDEATWEEEVTFQNQFPSFSLEDKAEVEMWG